MRKPVFFLLILFLSSSCSLFTTKTYTWDWRRDHLAYHTILKSCILSEAPELITVVPDDIKDYCPDYELKSPEQRLEFWGLLFSAISWMESSHRKEHFYEEVGITDSSGENVISRGLLQFSYESAKSYYPLLTSPEELHRPETSLKIGILVFKKFIIGDGVISAGRKGEWRGASRYWSVLRTNPKHLQIQNWLQNANYANPKENLIPPPPHVTPEDYESWFSKVFNNNSDKETLNNEL